MSGSGLAGRIKRAVATLLRGRAIASNQLGALLLRSVRSEVLFAFQQCSSRLTHGTGQTRSPPQRKLWVYTSLRLSPPL